MSTTVETTVIEITADTTPLLTAGPFIDPVTSTAYDLSTGFTNEFKYVDDCGADVTRAATGDAQGFITYRVLLTELNVTGSYWGRFTTNDGTVGEVSQIVKLKVNPVLPDVTP